MPTLFVAIVLLTGLAFGQSWPSDVFRIGPGITAPVPIYKPEPRYTPEAHAAEIQGSVMFNLVVDDLGKATNLSVVNPLSFGLDEEAQAAIETWRFQPGLKDGKPVKIGAVIEIHFGLRGRLSLDKPRNELRQALQQLRNEPKQQEQGLKTIQKLAQKNLPAAMYEYGRLLAAGTEVPADPDRARDLLGKAAAAKYGPAIFDLVATSIEQKAGSLNLEGAKASIFDAARLGSADAQYFLATQYEKGNQDLGFDQNGER